jgi:hypothetical protein
MQVETFECQETAAEPIEASEEAIAIIRAMGLKGQEQLVSPCQRSGRETRSPYRLMTAEERFVYLTLCPERTKIEDYADGPIPLRILQIGSHAKEIGVGEMLQVWHRSVPAVKDPVLVASGETYLSSYISSSTKFWILGRWGEELEAFSTLINRAVVVARERLIYEAAQMTHKAENMTFGEMVKIGPGINIEMK